MTSDIVVTKVRRLQIPRCMDIMERVTASGVFTQLFLRPPHPLGYRLTAFHCLASQQ